MWNEHYLHVERQLPRKNVIYVKYEDLKNKARRVHTLSQLSSFLGINATAEKLECAFVLAENPRAHRSVEGNKYMTKGVAYTKTLACRMWQKYGNFASRMGYSSWSNYTCGGYPPIPMVNVGPQGEYDSKWVKPGKKLLDFGEHPPSGSKAKLSLSSSSAQVLPTSNYKKESFNPSRVGKRRRNEKRNRGTDRGRNLPLLD